MGDHAADDAQAGELSADDAIKRLSSDIDEQVKAASK